MRRKRWFSGGAVALVLAVSPSAGADADNPAVVWYRSSEGCPDGSQFLERLGDRASWARLAQPGDHVDFVVTVAATDAGSTGQLQRQTERGTIAMSEVRDPSCDKVVEALALSLLLSLDPDQQQPATAESNREMGPPHDSAAAGDHPDVDDARPVVSPSVPTAAPGVPPAAAPSPEGQAPDEPDRAEAPNTRLDKRADQYAWLVGAQPGSRRMDGQRRCSGRTGLDEHQRR